MTDPQTLVAPTCLGLADTLAADGGWDDASLCEGWLVRHVVAHMTMPARLTPADYGAELAAAGGDFDVLSNTVALRDGALPADVLVEALRSPQLHSWAPPGGGSAGALSHAVIHSLDVTLALGRPSAAPDEALSAVLAELAGYDPPLFGVAPDSLGAEPVDAAERVALLAGRTLPDGRALPRA